MSANMIRCQKPHNMEQQKVVGRRKKSPYKSWKDNIEEWTGQSLSLVLHITDDRSWSATVSAEASVKYLDDALAS